MTPKRFVILAHARTGSWLLAETLDVHPNIVANGELFNPDDTGWGEMNDRHHLDTAALLEAAFASPPVRRHTTERLAVGFKVLEQQIRPGSSRARFWEIIRSDATIKVIVLRRNRLGEALRSFRQAEMTDRWQARSTDQAEPGPTVNLPVDRCVEFFERVAAFHARIAEAVEPRRRHTLAYEDLTGPERSAVLRSLQEFLDVPVHQLRQTTLHRQETRSLDETVTNIEELRAAFRGTPHSRYFE